jgi:hypothetical protein
METRDLAEEGFRPRRGGVENREGPFGRLRVNMRDSLALVTTSQQYFIVLGRFCAEKVTVGDQKLKVESQKLKVLHSYQNPRTC